MATGTGSTSKIMHTHNGKGLRQCDLFPRGGKKIRDWRRELKFTRVYDGSLTTYDALLAVGAKVDLLDGQVRSINPEEEKARFVTAMVGMDDPTRRSSSPTAPPRNSLRRAASTVRAATRVCPGARPSPSSSRWASSPTRGEPPTAPCTWTTGASSTAPR